MTSPNTLPVPEFEPADLKEETAVLVHDFHFPMRIVGRKGTLTIRKGFVSDGGSIPRLAWTLVNCTPFTPSWVVAFFIHDALYASELLPRKECDLILRDIGREYYNTIYQYQMIYWHVRLYGWIVWRGHKPDTIAAARQLVSLS